MEILPIDSALISGLERVSAVKNDLEKSSFADILNDALSDVKATDAQVTQTNFELLTGENDSIHSTMIDAEKAELALNLAIQVRNKVIDAYNEIMRMQL